MLNKVVPILRHGPSCDYHRTILPFKYLGFDIQPKPINYAAAELIVFNRLAHEPPERFFAQQKLHGFKYIVDIDDYWHLYPHHHIYANWQKAKFTEKIMAFIKGANAVTTTNSALAAKVAQLNKNVVIIPNALPFDHGQFDSTNNTDDQIRFVYAGGSSHYHDFALVAGAIKGTTRVNFTLAGIENNPAWLQMQALLRNVSYGKRACQPLDSYMSVYSNANVSLAPLEANEFNCLKSNLKMLEAGCKNLAFIASKTAPYFNELDKRYVMYAETESEWKALMAECIKDPAIVKEAGLQLGEHVRQHYDLRKVNEIRRQLYESML